LDPAAVYRTIVEATAYGYTQVSAYRLEDDALLLEVVLAAADGAR
jgi:hypothetical protein